MQPYNEGGWLCTIPRDASDGEERPKRPVHAKRAAGSPRPSRASAAASATPGEPARDEARAAAKSSLYRAYLQALRQSMRR